MPPPPQGPVGPGGPPQPPVDPSSPEAIANLETQLRPVGAPPGGQSYPGGNPNFDESTGTYRPGTGPSAPPPPAAPMIQPTGVAAGATLDPGREPSAPALPPGPAQTLGFQLKDAQVGGESAPAAQTYQVKLPNGTTVTTTAPKPPAWAGWTAAQKQKWAQNHTAPVAPPPGGSGQTGGGTSTGGQTGNTSGNTTTTPTDPTTGTTTTPPGDTTSNTPDVPQKGFSLSDGWALAIGGPVASYFSHRNQQLDANGNPIRHFDETSSPYGNWDYVAGTGTLTDKGTYNDAGFVTKAGKFKNWADVKDWNNLDPGYTDPQALIANRPDLLKGKDLYRIALEYDSAHVDKLNPLPDPKTARSPTTISLKGLDPPNGLLTDGSPDFIKNAGVRDLVIEAYRTAAARNNLVNADPFSRDYTKIKDLEDQLNVLRFSLAAYNIDYNPTPGGTDTGGHAGDTTQPGEYPGQWNTDPYQLATDTVGTIGSQYGKDIQNTFGIDKDSTTAARTAAYEAAMQRWAANVGLQNQSKAMNLGKQNLDLLTNSPIRSSAERLAQQIADHPDNTRYDLMRNQQVGAVNRQAEEAQQALAASAARRGVSAASVAGMQNEISRAKGGDLANLLGQLEIQKAAGERTGQMQGISALGQVYGYTGAQSEAIQRLQSILMGQAPVPSNPAAGIANTAINLQALQQSGAPTGPTPAQGAVAGAAGGAGAGATLGPWGAVIGGLAGGGAGYYNASKAA